MGLLSFLRKKPVAEIAPADGRAGLPVSAESMRTVATAPDFALTLKKAEVETLRLSILKNLSGENIRGLIPAGMHVSGVVRAVDGLKVDGHIAGSIEIEGDGLLVISPGAEVMGSIKAKRALVLGTVHGGAEVDSLVVHRQGRLNGEVKYLAAKMMGGQSARGAR